MAATATDLTFNMVASPITRQIIDGQVKAQGLRLQAEAAESIDTITRGMVNRSYDVGEMALATYVQAKERGIGLVALPFFTSGRTFPQRGIQLATRAGIEDLAELNGRRVGTPQFWLSTSVWQRWILREFHGVSPAAVSWVTFAPERLDPPGIPGGVEVRQETSGRDAHEMMAAGELDAYLVVPGGAGPKDDGVVKLGYPDPLQAQRDFYQRTGVAPLNHVAVIKEELAGDAQLIASLAELFEQAKVQSNPPAAPGMEDLLGDDPWAFGIGPNRKSLQAFLDAARAQGMINRDMSIAELFAGNLPERYQ